MWARGERPRRRLRPALGRPAARPQRARPPAAPGPRAAEGLQGLTSVARFFFFFPPLALVSLADVAAGGGRGSSVIAWDLGASLSSPFSSPAGAGVAKDFC